jgi:hypothetical protein
MWSWRLVELRILPVQLERTAAAVYEQLTWRYLMWDPKDRLDADMRYAVRMVETRCATIEQAAVMCGLELAALQAQLADLLPRTQVVSIEKPSLQLHRYVPGAH